MLKPPDAGEYLNTSRLKPRDGIL